MISTQVIKPKDSKHMSRFANLNRNKLKMKTEMQCKPGEQIPPTAKSNTLMCLLKRQKQLFNRLLVINRLIASNPDEY